MLEGDPGEDSDIGDLLHRLSRHHGAGDLLFQHPNLFNDGDGGQPVAPLHHHCFYPCMLGNFDSLGNLHPRGVDHPGEAKKGKTRLNLLHLILFSYRDLLVGHS